MLLQNRLRSVLIPGFDKIKEEAISNGALGCGISGSGPTIFAISTEEAVAQKVGKAIQAQFTALKLWIAMCLCRRSMEGAQRWWNSFKFQSCPSRNPVNLNNPP